MAATFDFAPQNEIAQALDSGESLGATRGRLGHFWDTSRMTLRDIK
jgi:hypothetical protein